MSKSDEMRRLIDLANGNSKPPVMEDTDKSPIANFSRWGKLNELYIVGEESSDDEVKIRVWQGMMDDNKWFWKKVHKINGKESFVKGGPCSSEKEAYAQAKGTLEPHIDEDEGGMSMVGEDMLDRPEVLDEATLIHLAAGNPHRGFCGAACDEDNCSHEINDVTCPKCLEFHDDYMCDHDSLDDEHYGNDLEEDTGHLMHLMRPRGGSECGAPCDEDNCSPEINDVTCPKCLKGHDDYMKQFEFSDDGEIDEDAESYLDRMYDAHLKAEGGFNYHTNKALEEAVEVDTITGPSYWASYLINGDDSGLSPEEITKCDAWQKSIEPWYVVDMENDTERFTWKYRLYGGETAGGSVVDYIVHKDTSDTEIPSNELDEENLDGIPKTETFKPNDDCVVVARHDGLVAFWNHVTGGLVVVVDDPDEHEWQERDGYFILSRLPNFKTVEAATAYAKKKIMPPKPVEEDVADMPVPEEPQSYTAYVWVRGTENNVYCNPIKGTEAPSKEACKARLAEYSEMRNPADPKRWLRTNNVQINPTPTHAVGKYL